MGKRKPTQIPNVTVTDATFAKVRNEAQFKATLERRRSNATVPAPPGNRYRRRPKHRAAGTDLPL